MGRELVQRIDVVKQTPWLNCASVSLAAILPEPLTGNEDLLGLAFHNDGTLDYLEGLVRVGLYRQGYCPITYENDRRPDVLGVLRDARKDTQENPCIELFGAMMLARKIEAPVEYLAAMEAYLAEEGYLVRGFDPRDYGVTNTTKVDLHAISIVSMNQRAGRKKAGIIDTSIYGWDRRGLPRYVSSKRADGMSLKANPFYDAYPIVSRGIRFENLNYDYTGIPMAFWDNELRELDELSEQVREAGREFL